MYLESRRRNFSNFYQDSPSLLELLGLVMSHAKCVGDLCTILCSRLSVGVQALVQGDFVKHRSKSQIPKLNTPAWT